MDAKKTRIGRDSVEHFVEAGEKTSVHDSGPIGVSADTSELHLHSPPQKYQIEGHIGSGGMGTVMLVTDNDLRRQVAMKVMKPEMGLSPRHRRRFMAEAQATSQLEHPGIPPVHDIGISEDDQMYFTMKVVRGRTLAQVLHDLFLARKEARREFTLHRLVSILERLCEAVHFAHEKGVIHRDLKPENLMLGDYGEVHVMDWGIAKVLGAEDEMEPLELPVETVESGSTNFTLDGAITGTVPYMSPEQASGQNSRLDRRSDIYALGCILYEVLTLHAAFEGDNLLERVKEGDCPDVAQRNPKRTVPEGLADLTRRSMAVYPDDRPETAEDFRLELRAWLDGTSERNRRSREADVLARQGRDALKQYERLKKDVAAAIEKEKQVSLEVKPWMPVDEIQPLLDAAEHVSTLRRAMLMAHADAVNYLNGALMAEEGNADARAALARLWSDRLKEDEKRGEADRAAYALTMVKRYDDGHLREFVAGDGSIRITVEPVEVELSVCEFSERNGILRLGDEESLGRTPFGIRPLAMGSYLFILRAPGFPDVRYPVHIRRKRSWSGHVRIRPKEIIGDGFVYVPGGPALIGDHDDAQTIEIPDFAISRTPVTFEDWGIFLAAIEAEDGVDSAQLRVPGNPADGPLMVRGDDGVWNPLSAVCEGPLRDLLLESHGEGFESKIPVISITFDDAVEYCAWKTKTTGMEWRLPTQQEREKAARGVDGRRFPWGSLDHPSMARCQLARKEPAQPEPVATFPAAESVYGMLDAAGNIWEWTDSWKDGRNVARTIKGGAWDAPSSSLACAFAHSLEPFHRAPTVGFRCARTLPE